MRAVLPMLLWLFVAALGMAVGSGSAAALNGRGRRFVAVGAPVVILAAAAVAPVDLSTPAEILFGISGAVGVVGIELGLAAYTIWHGVERSSPQPYLS